MEYNFAIIGESSCLLEFTKMAYEDSQLMEVTLDEIQLSKIFVQVLINIRDEEECFRIELTYVKDTLFNA